ncbi:MAG: MMPL family transporter [Halofilum sp. (in: g-proteobacteria)]
MSPRFILGGWVALVLVCLGLTLSARVATDLQAFLPGAANPEQELIVEEIRAGAASGLIMVVAGSAQRPAEPGDVERLRRALEESGNFRLVASRPDPALLTARDELFRYRYLLSNRIDTDAFSAEALRPHFSELAERLARGDPMIDERVAAADPTGEFRYLLERWLGASASPEDAADGWQLDPGRSVLLAVADAEPYDLDAQEAALRTIETEAGALDPALPVELAGAPAIATTSRDTIRSEAVRVSVLASIGTLLILLFALRSPRAAVLALVPVVTGLLAGAAAVRLGFGELHGITLAFGVTLLGVTIDYPLHHFWHRAGGVPIRGRLFVSALSTALGFAAMAVAGYPGLQQLALLSATGILVAAATTAWVLPVLAGTTGAPKTRAPGSAGRGLSIPRWAPAAAAGALMLAGVGAALGGLDLQTNLAAMSPIPAEAAERDRTLRARLGLAEPRFVVQLAAPDREAALRETEALTEILRANDDRVGRFDAATELVPSARTQAQRAQELPTPESLRASLRAALEDLPLRASAFAPFVDAVASSRELTPLVPENLPPGLVRQRIDQRLQPHGDRWVSTVHLGGVNAPADLAATLEQAGGWRLVDLRAEASALVTSYQRQAVGHFALGSGLIALVILAGTRSLRRTVSVVAIAAGGVGGTLAVLGTLDTAVSVFHVIALLLVVGLGIDYGLFARAGDRAGRGSVSVCAVSTILAFSILATADIPLLRAIGVTVACGTLLAWCLAMLFARGERSAANIRVS